MTNGYRALREGAGLLDISQRARIRATGEDRQRLLHALATNVIEGLGPGQGAETFFLNAQGRIQTHCRVYIADESVLLETSARRRQTLLDYLDGYIIMDDVALEDVTDSTTAFALEGPLAEQTLTAALGLAPGAAPHSHLSVGDASVHRSTLSGSPGFWIAGPGDVREKLLEAGAAACTHDDLEVVRVENRVPAFDFDYFDTNIPHETDQLQIVSFTKGCYTGQEIVERVRSQGRVNRLLRPIEIDAETAPEDPAVTVNGKEVGKATSLVVSPRAGAVAGFAILRREAAETGSAIAVGGAPGRVLGWTD